MDNNNKYITIYINIIGLNMIEIKLNETNESLSEISKKINEYEKNLYQFKIEHEILNIANILKTEDMLSGVSLVSFDIDKQDGEYTFDIYCYDEDNEHIDDFNFNENIYLTSNDIDYLIKNGYRFEGEFNVRKDTNIVLEIAQILMHKIPGEQWYNQKKSEEQFEVLNKEIKNKSPIKRPKV